MPLVFQSTSATPGGASVTGAVLIMALAELGSYICAGGAIVIFAYLIWKG